MQASAASTARTNAPRPEYSGKTFPRGDLYAFESNHGRGRPRRSDDGAISRVVDVSATQGHIVPTALACKGNFFVGNLDTFPVVPGTEAVFKLTPSGNLSRGPLA